jgi:23S rRNA (adenine2503-C2)-methyltransferase
MSDSMVPEQTPPNSRHPTPASPLRTLPTHLLNILHTDLPSWLADQGERPFRGQQIRQWLFHRRADDFAAMTDLPTELRQKLAEHFQLWSSTVVKHQQSEDGTEKLLLRLHDGGRIECVLLRDGTRRSICISSQVGCAMGCVFCASGLDGVERNLTAGELLEQMLRLQRLLPAEERLSHIVVMGMGEPLANLQALLPALDEATNPQGLGISPRRITISTVGLPPAIRELAAKHPRYNLAVSLHAPEDALRDRLVPVNKNIGIEAILAAADAYFEASGRKLTFEYVLLGGLNDSPQHAHQLARLLRHRTALLNIIPYNPVAGLPYKTPTQASIRRFRDILEGAGVTLHVRERKGDAIQAACGQLRRSTPASPIEAVVPLASPSPSSPSGDCG